IGGERLSHGRDCDPGLEALPTSTLDRDPTMTPLDITTLDWSKGDGLLPAIVQDAHSGQVLMLGFMNQDALRTTIDSRRVTFYSRTKQRLWTKGETSQNFLNVVDIAADCDRDSLL